MKKNIIIIILTVASIVLAGALYFANRQLTELEEQLAATKPAPTAETEAVSVEPAEPIEVVEAAARETISTLQEQAVKAIPEPAVEKKEESSGQRMMKNIAKLMENPTMNKMMEASQRGALGAMYEDLINQFNLNEEEKEYFMELLMFRQMTQMDVGMKLMGGGLSDEEKEKLTAQMKDASDLVKSEMKDFLNSDEDYENFEFFEKTMAERMVLSQAEATLANTDQALSDDTYHNLVEMMYDQKQNFDFSTDFQDEKNMDMSPERFSQQNLTNFGKDLDRLNETIFSKAQSMLTAEQFEAFKQAVTTTTDMQKTQLEMAAQMLGGKK